jgi:hypothetical protein
MSIWESLNISELSLDFTARDQQREESILGTPEPRRITIDQGQAIKYVCVLGLVAAVVISSLTLGFGIVLVRSGKQPIAAWLQDTVAKIGRKTLYANETTKTYFAGHKPLRMSAAAMTLAPLLLNYAITAVLAGLSFIQATTLRWALWSEDRLPFNSNPRLLLASRSYAPNAWYTNFISATSLIFVYGALALLTSDIKVIGYSDGQYDVREDKPHTDNGLDVNGSAIVIMASCLLLQSLLSSWCMFYRSQLVKTWSENPLMVTRACAYHQSYVCEKATTFQSSEASTMSNVSWMSKLEWPAKLRSRSTKMSNPDYDPRLPRQAKKGKTLQPSARSIIPTIRHVTLILWLYLSLIIITVIIISIVGYKRGTTDPSYATTFGWNIGSSKFWVYFGQVYFKYTSTQTAKLAKNFDALTIVLQTLFQAPLTLVLHYSELLIDVVRDERTWREASSERGAKVNENIAIGAIKNWPGLILFLFKGLTQWVYSYAFVVDAVVSVSLLPLVTFAVLMLLLAVFAECLSRWEPEGRQPATWGNLELLGKYMEIMDGERVYWVDHDRIAEGHGAT